MFNKYLLLESECIINSQLLITYLSLTPTNEYFEIKSYNRPLFMANKFSHEYLVIYFKRKEPNFQPNLPIKARSYIHNFYQILVIVKLK